ncbi:MAG: class I SAM-dependent methyltransferase [Thermoplasmata archaeon]
MQGNKEDKVKEFFGKNADKYVNSLSHEKGGDLYRLLALLEPANSDIAADFATGTGFTAIALSRYVNKVFAIDITVEMLAEAKKLSEKNNITNIEFLNENVIATTFKDNSLDIAVTRRAAHHFSDKQAFVLEVRRVLKNGGKLGIVDMVIPENDNIGFFNTLEKTRDSSHNEALKYTEWLAMLEKLDFTIYRSELFIETLQFKDWLYPLVVDSIEGINCLRFLKNMKEEAEEIIQFDESSLTFIKRRAIIIATK